MGVGGATWERAPGGSQGPVASALRTRPGFLVHLAKVRLPGVFMPAQHQLRNPLGPVQMKPWEALFRSD